MEEKGHSKLRVFVDTNILISGIFFSGNEEKLIELSEQKKLTLVVSDFILEEIKEVSEKNFGILPEISKDFLAEADLEIITRERYYDKVDESKKLIRDQKDAPVLAAVLISKPDYFITGDEDFHTKEIKKLVNVITTGEFLDYFLVEEG